MKITHSGGRVSFAALSALGVCLVLAVGCNPEAPSEHAEGHGHGHSHEHEHGDRPESLHAAVATLDEMHEAIRVAIANDDTEAAHGPLHEVGDLLNAIPEIAAETDLNEEDWEAVDAAKERLFDAFGAIDKAFHVKDGDKKGAYEQVAADLEGALEEIRSRLPRTGEDPDAHDHDAHDHEGHDHAHSGAGNAEVEGDE